MEANEGLSSGGMAVRGDEAPDGFRVAPRSDNSLPNPNSNPSPNLAPNISNPSPVPTQYGGLPLVQMPVPTPVPGSGTEIVKKKRGRPRKYGPDGALNPSAVARAALSPMPISSSVPLTGEFSAWKRGRGKPVELVKRQQKYEYESPAAGDKVAYFVGANFTPHVLMVNTGEDVTMKIMSFVQQGARAICILSANGTISNVTLRQSTSSGGTLTYEGRFEILSLSGSYMPTENGGTKSRSGGMSVSLAGPDGRVVGGCLAGLLVAAGPVQVVVGSFLPGHQQEQKQKKQRVEPAPVITPTSVTVLSAEDLRAGYGAVKPVLIPAPSFHGNHSSSFNPVHAYPNPSADNATSSAEDDSRGPDSNCDVSC